MIPQIVNSKPAHVSNNGMRDMAIILISSAVKDVTGRRTTGDKKGATTESAYDFFFSSDPPIVLLRDHWFSVAGIKEEGFVRKVKKLLESGKKFSYRKMI